MSEDPRLEELKFELESLRDERNRLERERNSPNCGPGAEYHLGMRLDSLDRQIDRIEENIREIFRNR